MEEKETVQLPVSEQELQIQPPSFCDKLKIHKFKILEGILGVLVFAGAVFGAYKVGQRQAKLIIPTLLKLTPTPAPLCSDPCPQFMPPIPDFCKDGTLIPGEKDECGCQMPPKCEKSTANWKTYTNTKLGFSLKYPQDWDPLLEESIHSTRSEVSFAPYFSIEVGVFYHQDKQRELTYQEVVKQFAKTEEKPWETTLDGQPASRIENLIAAQKSRNIYLISAYSLTRSPMDKQTFNLMLSTFRFLEEGNKSILPKKKVNLPPDCVGGNWRGIVRKCAARDVPLYNPGYCKANPYLLELEDSNIMAFKNDEDFENLEGIIGKQLILIGCMPKAMNMTEGPIVYVTEISLKP